MADDLFGLLKSLNLPQILTPAIHKRFRHGPVADIEIAAGE